MHTAQQPLPQDNSAGNFSAQLQAFAMPDLTCDGTSTNQALLQGAIQLSHTQKAI